MNPSPRALRLVLPLLVAACGPAASPAASSSSTASGTPAATSSSASSGAAGEATRPAAQSGGGSAPSGGGAAEPSDNALESARSLAGPGAADCGRAEWGVGRTSADECVVATFRHGRQPFYAGYESRDARDYETIEFLVRDASGNVFTLRTEPAPVGSDRAHRRIDREPCTDPHIATFGGVERLSCRRIQ